MSNSDSWQNDDNMARVSTRYTLLNYILYLHAILSFHYFKEWISTDSSVSWKGAAEFQISPLNIRNSTKNQNFQTHLKNLIWRLTGGLSFLLIFLWGEPLHSSQ